MLVGGLGQVLSVVDLAFGGRGVTKLKGELRASLNTEHSEINEGPPSELTEAFWMEARDVARRMRGVTPDERGDALSQAGLIFLTRGWRSFDPKQGSIEAFARKLTINAYRDNRRHQQRRTRRDTSLDALANPDRHSFLADPTEVKTEISIDLSAAIDQLPTNQRAVVLLKLHYDMTDVRVAEALDLPLGTVKSHTGSAYRKLRPLLGG